MWIDTWYTFWLSVIDRVFYWPIQALMSIASLSAGFDFIVTVAPYVGSLVLFFTDTSIFPMYLQLAFAWFAFCYLVSLVTNFLRTIWAILPFF